MTTVPCANCGATLNSTLPYCPACGRITVVDAVVVDTPRFRFVDKPWVLIVLLLHVGLLGIPIYWTSRHSLGTRWTMVIGSIAYTLFAIAVILWGLSQIMRVFYSFI